MSNKVKILYENKDDYKKAGFVMISDEDPTGRDKAYKQMIICNIFNTFMPVCMAGYGMIDPTILIPYMFF